MKLSIVIPAYNEKERIGHTIQVIQNYLRDKDWQWELIVVDDGSTDYTAELVEHIAPEAKILRQENRGKGVALRRGILQSGGDWILLMDADNSSSIGEIEKLLPFVKDYDIIIGSRATPDAQLVIPQKWLKRTLGRFGNLLIRLFLGLPFKDTQCGFKLLRREIRDLCCKLYMPRWSFDFELLYAAYKKGYRIKEVGVRWENDERSKVKPSDYFKTLRDIFKIKRNFRQGHYD